MSSLPLASTVAEPTLLEAPQSTLWRRALVRGRKGVSGGALYALGDQIVFSFGNMVVAALLSRHCDQVQFGIYILTQRAMDVLIQLSNGFLWTPLTFALPRLTAERRAPYQGSVVLLQLCLCLVFTGLLWLAAGVCARPAHASLRETFQPLILSGGALLFREFTRRLYFADLRLKEAFWTEVATVLAQIAGVDWFYHRASLTVSNTLLALGGGAALVSGWWLLRDWRRWTVTRHGALADLRQDLQMGRWLFGGNMMALTSAQCNPWVLNALLGSASVGSYSISESLVNIPRAVLTSMQNVMGPLVARAHHEGGVVEVRRVVRRINLTLCGAATGLGLIVVAGAPWIARLIYRTAPDNTRWVAGLLALNLVAYVATLAQTYGLTALGRADATFYANAFGVVIQAAIGVFLIRALHVPGAALALLLGSVAVLLTRQWSYARQIALAVHE